MSDTLVYKILDASDWAEALAAGTFQGSPDDARDGFVHLSSAHQLEETAQKHFRGQDDLVLVALNAPQLGDTLKWEPSRGGDLFPHHYGPLPVSAAVSVEPLRLDEQGIPEIPDHVTGAHQVTAAERQAGRTHSADRS